MHTCINIAKKELYQKHQHTFFTFTTGEFQEPISCDCDETDSSGTSNASSSCSSSHQKQFTGFDKKEFWKHTVKHRKRPVANYCEHPQQMSKERKSSIAYSSDEQQQRMAKIYYLESSGDEQRQRMSKRRQRSVAYCLESSDGKQPQQMSKTGESHVACYSEASCDEQPQLMLKRRRKYPSVISKALEPLSQKASSSEELLYNLPPEILEIIFCLMPLQELYLSCRLVCKLWNEIIMRKKARITWSV